MEQNLLAGWFPTVEVGKDVEFAGDLPQGAARVRYRAKSDGLARREADELVVPLAPSSTMTSHLAPLVKRTLPVVLPPNTAPSHQTRTIRIVPPPGYRAAELAADGEEQGGEFGYARVEMKKDDARAVVVKRKVVFDMSTIPVDKYDAWRAWLQRVDALLASFGALRTRRQAGSPRERRHALSPKRFFASVLMTACAAASCGGRQLAPARGDAKFDLVKPFADAVEGEQTRGAALAIKAYLDLLDQSLIHSSAPHAIEATLASVDALVHRTSGSLERISNDHALAFRHPGAKKLVADRLEQAYTSAGGAGPFARGVIADGALALAMHEGDAALAKKWRDRNGCARAATVVGPARVGADHGGDARNPARKNGRPARGLVPRHQTVRGERSPHHRAGRRMRHQPPHDQRARRSARGRRGRRRTQSADDRRLACAPAPRQRWWWATRSLSSAATSSAAGAYKSGRRRRSTRAGCASWRASAPTARAAACGSTSGPKMARRSPRAHPSRVPSRQRRSSVPTRLVLHGNRASQAELALVAAARLALGDARSAEHLLEEGSKAGKGPLASLLYGRSIEEAGDLPENRAIERQRDAFETVLKAWPTAWEAVLGHAQLTARRRGASEGRIEALREIAGVRAEHPDLDPMVSAFEAATAAEGHLFDVAETSYQSAKKAVEGTPFLADLDDAVHDRVGAEREQHYCRAPGTDRSSLDCLEAKVARGDRRGALGEIARLRVLRDSPLALRQLELTQYIALGDEAGMKVYLSLLPAERTLASLGLLLSRSPAELRARMLGDMTAAADSPGALPGLSVSLLDSPAPQLEAEGAARVAADRKTRSLSNAATAVLRHTERYLIGDGGLLHYTLYDLRRVSGTTDVEQGAQGAQAIIEGRDVRRILRRRIHKPDGRVLEPDKASYASQEHSDLSQLEKGDYIEQIVEGWALPGAAGQLVVDTPDLLPERTSVDEASIELRRPATLDLSIWSHAQWGKRSERIDGSQKVTTFSVKDHAPRRLEEGVPKMDRDVSVSFGTSSWQLVGRSIAEAIASLDDRDPFVSAWSHNAARGTKDDTPRPASASTAEAAVAQRTVVERIAVAAGKSVKVASGAVLSDLAGALSAGAQGTTARTILELGQGSRSWLAYRALREVGIPAEIVVAERDPFSADPQFPPHFGRFDYPLVLAHTKDGDVWLDLDVQGPPLPAGRVSPELRGRVAMNAKGDTLRVGGSSMEDARDEVDIRLKLDEKGNAQGTFTILLRGRTAQSLADALEKVVGTDRSDMLAPGRARLGPLGQRRRRRPLVERRFLASLAAGAGDDPRLRAGRRCVVGAAGLRTAARRFPPPLRGDPGLDFREPGRA